MVSSGFVEDDDEDVVIVEARAVAAGKRLVRRFPDFPNEPIPRRRIFTECGAACGTGDEC